MAPTFSPRTEHFLSRTDVARRTEAHNIWMSGRESGTPDEICSRLRDADGKRYQEE